MGFLEEVAFYPSFERSERFSLHGLLSGNQNHHPLHPQEAPSERGDEIHRIQDRLRGDRGHTCQLLIRGRDAPSVHLLCSLDNLNRNLKRSTR